MLTSTGRAVRVILGLFVLGSIGFSGTAQVVYSQDPAVPPCLTDPALMAGAAYMPEFSTAASTLILKLEAENGNGGRADRPRSGASNKFTNWLCPTKGSTAFRMNLTESVDLIRIRYSNRNSGPLESVQILVDKQSLCTFSAQDTDDWNVFRWASCVLGEDIAQGPHTLRISASGGDGFGVEIDVIQFRDTIQS